MLQGQVSFPEVTRCDYGRPLATLNCTQRTCRTALTSIPSATSSRRKFLHAHSWTRRHHLCSASHHAKQERPAQGQSIAADGMLARLAELTANQKQKAAQAGAGVLLAGLLAFGGPAIAADVAKTGACLLSNCQGALAQCIADGQCLENLVCLQRCNGRPDEIACQIRCGDLYQDTAIETFNTCAVSNKKCVPQRVDNDAYPVPPDCALDEKFDLNNFQGRWYITAGLNPLFDQFDCQEHYFGVPEPGKLYGKINWRIPKGDKDFLERSTVQTFKQVSNQPAKLENHDNAFLHYSDDWYILAQKPDEYIFIYYIGNNDAWKGYGGATVYTRAASLPQEYIPELKEKAAAVGLKWDDFKITDNSCGPHPPQINLAEKIEKLAEEDIRAVEYTLENDLKSFGRGFTVIEQDVSQELLKEEKIVEEELREAERFLENIEQQYVAKLPAWLQAPLNVFKSIKIPFLSS